MRGSICPLLCLSVQQPLSSCQQFAARLHALSPQSPAQSISPPVVAELVQQRPGRSFAPSGNFQVFCVRTCANSVTTVLSLRPRHLILFPVRATSIHNESEASCL